MTDLAVTDIGGRAPAVVLLHEGAGSAASWQRLSRRYAGDRRLLAYDRRGFGGSPRDASFGADHFAQAARDLAGLLDERGLGAAHLVGHSDGGSIALELAIRRPDLAQTVTVIDTHVYREPVTVEAVRALGDPSSWGDKVIAAYADQHGDDWHAVVSAWQQLWVGPALAAWDLRPRLGAIECPVLVVHDRRDPMSPAEHAEAVVSAGARPHWTDLGTHWPHRVDVAGVAAVVTAFQSDHDLGA